MNPITLVLSIIYDLIMFATWGFGVFGVSATRTERRKAAFEREQELWPEAGYMNYPDSRWRYRVSTGGALVVVFIAGVLWPIGIPLWFAWRKGEFIDRAIAARDKESE